MSTQLHPLHLPGRFLIKIYILATKDLSTLVLHNIIYWHSILVEDIACKKRKRKREKEILKKTRAADSAKLSVGEKEDLRKRGKTSRRVFTSERGGEGMSQMKLNQKRPLPFPTWPSLCLVVTWLNGVCHSSLWHRECRGECGHECFYLTLSPVPVPPSPLAIMWLSTYWGVTWMHMHS